MNILSTVTKEENIKVAKVKHCPHGQMYNYKFYSEVIGDLNVGDEVIVVNKDGSTHIAKVHEITDYSDNASCWVIYKLDVKKLKQNYYKQKSIELNIKIGE